MISITQGLTITKEWLAVRGMLEGVAKGKSIAGSGLMQMIQKEVDASGKEAARSLKSDISKNLYRFPRYVLRGGSVETIRRQDMKRAAVYTGSTLAGHRIHAGIFDKDEISEPTPHRSDGSGPYYEILEKGHAPYVMTQKQRQAWAIILQQTGQNDKKLKTQYGKIRADNPQSGLGLVHPGIRPYRFFAKTQILWHELLNKRLIGIVGRCVRQTSATYKDIHVGTRKSWFGTIPKTGYVWR